MVEHAVEGNDSHIGSFQPHVLYGLGHGSPVDVEIKPFAAGNALLYQVYGCMGHRVLRVRRHPEMIRRIVVHLAVFLVQHFGLTDDLFGVANEGLSQFGGFHAGIAARKNGDPQAVLQIFYRGADAGLGDEKISRGVAYGFASVHFDHI
jgi:hypothetical protein